jgi:RNA ligase (TIGR02306 family)
MQNLNSVCYIATINEIKPIEGADNIELAVVGGWNCVVKKGIHQVGNMVVCITTDAVIPTELSEMLGVANYLRNGSRVRTVRLRGVYSECLIIELHSISQLWPKLPGVFVLEIEHYWQEGDDLMELLNISKYEPPIKQIQLSSGKKIRYKSNQNFHVYYKFPNLKNVSGMFTEEDNVQITRKIHGTNARYGFVKKSKLSFWDKFKKWIRLADKWIEYDYIYGSHNVEKGSDSQGFYSTDVWRTIDDKYNIRENLIRYIKLNETPESIGTGITIYGEIFGEGIQKNYNYGLKDIRFVGFDVTINQEYKDCRYTEQFFHNSINLAHVEVLYEGMWSEEIKNKFVFKNFITGTKIPHEGIVVKHISGDRKKVAKIINPEYLIASEKHDYGDSH